MCSKCEEEFLAGITDSRTLQDYTKLDVGFTESGLQVWCRRHDTNVVHIDFEGRKLKADFRCLERGDSSADDIAATVIVAIFAFLLLLRPASLFQRMPAIARRWFSVNSQ